jgi:hypothetical protein
MIAMNDGGKYAESILRCQLRKKMFKSCFRGAAPLKCILLRYIGINVAVFPERFKFVARKFSKKKKDFELISGAITCNDYRVPKYVADNRSS